MFVSAHTCGRNFVAGAEGFERTWANYYPPFIRRYAPDGVSPLSADQLQNEVSEIWRYFVGTYWALTTIATVGFGDVTPATIAETVVVMGVEIIGILFFGILISTISELLSNLNKMARRAHTFRKKLTSVERWLQMSDIPRRLQRRIKSYYAEVGAANRVTILWERISCSYRN